MHRFHLPPAACQGPTLTLEGQEAHHALRVLRVRPGERVVVLDGAGGEHLCEVSDCERGRVALTVRRKELQAPPACRLTLLQGVAKAKSMDLIVQKATELGAQRIVPILAERCIPQLDEELASQKTAKWRATAIEAAKQSGLAWLPAIPEPVALRDWLARAEPFDLTLLASLQPGSQHPRDVLTDWRAAHGRYPRTMAVWIGPEGDYTPGELGAIRSAGAAPISLGPLVLRSETAALYTLAVLGYESQWHQRRDPPAPPRG